MINLLLMADVIFTSRLYRISENVPLQPILLGLAIALTFFYMLLVMQRGLIWAPTLLLAMVALTVTQLYVFSSISGVAINWNAGFQFCWIATFIVFYLAIVDGHGQYLLTALLRYASIYVLLYSGLAVALQAGVLSLDTFSGLILNDDERGNRLFIYGVAATFCWFSWLVRFQATRGIFSFFMLIASGAAIYLSFSRVIALVALVLTALYVSRVSLKNIAIFCLLVLYTISAVLLAGILDNSWNPFSVFASDSSGSFRMWEYELARTFLREHFFFGAGIPPNGEDVWDLVQQEYFAASDLGLMGVWFDWGFTGLVLFIAASFVACRPGIDLDSESRTPLLLTGCLMAAYGCIAPVIFYPAGVTYFAVLLGFFLARGRATPLAEGRNQALARHET